MIRGEGLLLQHVKPRAAQLAALQRRHQILRAYHAAPGHVHQECPRFHFGKGFRVHHVVGLVGEGQGEDNKVRFRQDGVDGVPVSGAELGVQVVHALDGELVVAHQLHAHGVEALGQHPSVVPHADDPGGAAIQPPPLVGALHPPLALLLGGQQLLGVVAVLEHEVDAVFRQHRGAAARRAGHRDASCKHLRSGGAVQPRVVTVDPLQRVFSQQAGIHIPQKDGHVGVPHLPGQRFLVVKVHVLELCLGKDLAKGAHVFLVIPNSRHDLVYFRHMVSS